MKKISLLLAVMLLSTALLSGCSSDKDQQPDGAKKDTLVVAISSAPSTLDGNGKNDSSSLEVRAQIYEGLVGQNEQMEIVPLLAESWEYENDTTLIFNIRKGVKFHNGDEVKASDVAFSLKRAYDGGYSESALSAVDFEKCEVVDEYTYKMVLKYPFAPILASVADASAVIVPQKVVEENGSDYLSSNPVGTGPYTLKEWVQGDRIELVKNENYWGESKGVKNIVMRFISEVANRAIEVEVGGVDIAYDISPNDIGRLEDNKDVVVQRTPNLATTYIAFNCEKEMFKDKRVRQAVGHALDLTSIVDAVYFGVGSTGKSMIAPTVWGYSENVKPLEYDIEKAKQLLAEAGYADGLNTTIWVSDNQQRIDIAEIAQNSLKNVGINAEVKILEWGTFLEAVENKELDIFILGSVASSGDGDALYDSFYSKSHFSGNTAYYKDAEMDKLLEASRSEIDPEKRAKILEEIQIKAIEEAPWIPVWHGEVVTASRSNVKGFVNHPTNFHSLANVYFE